MLEIIHTRHLDQTETPSAVFHLTNPEKTPWSSLIPAIQEKYPVEPVDFGAWVAEPEGVRNPTSADVASMPALRLLDFYRGLADGSHAAMTVDLDVQRAKGASATMRVLEPISASLMANWLEQWRF